MDVSMAAKRKLNVEEARVLGELADEVLDERGKIREDADSDKLALFRQLCLRSNAPALEELRNEVKRLVKSGYVFLGWISTKHKSYGCKLAGEYHYLKKELIIKHSTVIGQLGSPIVEKKRQSVWVLCPDGSFMQIGERLSPEFQAKLNPKL